MTNRATTAHPPKTRLHHTCTLTDGPCQPCETLAAEWLGTADHISELHTYDAMACRAPGDVTDWDAALTAGNPGQGDPQHAYATDRDAARAALRAARALPVVADVLAVVRTTGRAPRANRADYRAARAAILATYATTAREAGEALPPDHGTGEIGWRMPWRPDARTLAGPVVSLTADGAVSVYRDVTTATGKGSTRARTTTREVLPVPVVSALTVRAVLTYGTRWSPDASTFAADRFAAACEPAGPVRKPSSRKRRRDGAVGGPCVITSAPTHGAR